MADIHILFENDAWMAPLREALTDRGLTWTEHFTDGGTLDLTQAPPEGIWINRMSPSSHTRGHQGGVVFVGAFLHHLEAHGRRVINGSNAFALEVSKVRQDLALRRAGISTPKTLAVIGDMEALKSAARTFDGPFITKHNQGGKGLGVKLFEDLEAFDAHVDSDEFILSPDGVMLLQQYIKPAEPFVTRVEIVGDRLQYAIRASTEDGFELCPAAECDAGTGFCPVGGTGKFTRDTTLTQDDPLVQSYLRLMEQQGIDLAGIEFVTDADGHRITYDINGTTNYNADVEAQHGLNGMGSLADLVVREVQSRRHRAAAK